MNAVQKFKSVLQRRITKRDPLPPADWCVKHLRFNEASNRAPFSISGAEYVRDVLNDFGDSTVTDETLVWGSQTRKTGTLMGGMAWTVVNDPSGVLWVMPSITLAQKFGRQRWLKMLKASPIMQPYIPTGAARHDFATLTQLLGSAAFNFVGSNSAANLSSNPCRRVICDEVDKFPDASSKESNALDLAEQRTKGQVNPQRWKTSTPTLDTALIWREYLKGDQRRYFVPCPHCQKEILFIWSKEMSILPKQGCEAVIRWDESAKVGDEWDLDKVERTAHLVCPHCSDKILDHHKPEMIRKGIWRATNKNAPSGFVSRHLSSLYSTMPECNFGSLAKKFLQAQSSTTGLQGFINGDLAEPYAAQDKSSSKIEVTSTPLAQPDWIRLMTCDYQKNWPYIWFVIRAWCSFKLLPKAEMQNGLPEFVEALELPENAAPRESCLKLIGCERIEHMRQPQYQSAWNVVAELARFNSNNPDTGRSPMIDFLLAQKITGQKLVEFFGKAGSALELRKKILAEMHALAGGSVENFRAPIGGDSELIAAGHCDRSGEYAWDEMAEIAAEFRVGAGMKIPARCLAIDCGYAEFKNRVVLQKVHESASEFDYYDPTLKTKEPVFMPHASPFFQKHGWNGWQALRGKPTFRTQGSGLGRDLGKHVEDPYFGTSQAGSCVVDILEVPTDLFWIRKNDIREKKTRQVCTVSPKVSFFPKIYSVDGTRTGESRYSLENYQRDSSVQYWDERTQTIKKRGGTGGAASKRNPDHIDDCETYQIALASHLEFFEPIKTTNEK